MCIFIQTHPLHYPLKLELDGEIRHYPDHYHNGSKVTFIFMHLSLAIRYRGREKVNFMTFCTLMHTYVKLFEAEGRYTLYYEWFFRVTHPVKMWNSRIYPFIYYMKFKPQCLSFFHFYFYEASEWTYDEVFIKCQSIGCT